MMTTKSPRFLFKAGHVRRQAGFTLLEILIAFSVVGIISAVTIASFGSFSKSQQLQQATNEVLATVKQAKSYAQSQVKPDSCVGKELEGYRVEFCGTACVDPNRHKIQVRCGGANFDLLQGNTARHIVNADIAQSGSFIFRIQGGPVTNGQTGQESIEQSYYDIGITNSAGTKTIRVTNYGAISIL